MKKIAVIGIGIMGNGIATNFLKNGYEVYVWDRNKDKLKDLTQKGFKVLRTPKQGAEFCEAVFEVTANDESSRTVWLNSDGILAGANKESILVTNATLSLAWVRELAKLCEQKNMTFFDLPMTGSRAAAEGGKLVLFAGGNEGKLQEFRPTLDAIAEKVIYFGKAGSGMVYKLINNMMAAVHIISFGEEIKVAKANNLDVQKVGQTLSERGGLATIMAWRDFQNAPDPINFAVKWIQKDLGYAKGATTEELPFLKEALKTYEKALKEGLGDNDWSVVNRDI